MHGRALTYGSGEAAEPTFRSALRDEDVRMQLDKAVRRGWLELFRRTSRVGILVGVDVALSLAAAVLAIAGSAGLAAGPAANGLEPVMPVLVIQPLLLALLGCYGPGRGRIRYLRISIGVWGGVAIGALEAHLLGLPLSATQWTVYAGLASTLVLLGRRGADWAISTAHSSGIGVRRVLVVGREGETDDLSTLLKGVDGQGLLVVGRVAPDEIGGVVGRAGPRTRRRLEHLLRANQAEGVLVASSLTFASLEALARNCFELGASIGLMPRAVHELGGSLGLRTSRAGSFLHLHPTGLRLPQLAIKRAIDLVLCVIALLLAFPLILSIAIAIKLDSPGPILFRHERAGVGGRAFWMYKFRTMVADADSMKRRLQHLNESGDPRLFKIRHDPRVTRTGRFLRRTSLDEIPQLLNVLRGEMSLVGPRPFFPQDLQAYEDHHFERLLVLPGITGLWQVSGRSDVLDFEEVVRLDAEYIRNWSVGLDLSILLRTVPATLGRGAY